MSVLIIGSGSNIDKDILKNEKTDVEYVICADGGLEKAEYLGLLPNVIVGDLDSVDEKTLKKYKDMGINIIKYSTEKDYTDMELAIKYAIEKDFKDITLVGATGTRLDHTMANIMLIEEYYKQGIKIKIVDNNNTIEIIINEMNIKNKEGYFVSIIPISDVVEKITLEGFKYSLTNRDVKRGSALCVSNQIISKSGKITIKGGIGLVFISKD